MVNSYPRISITFLLQEELLAKSNENFICIYRKIFSFVLLAWTPVGSNITKNCRTDPKNVQCWFEITSQPLNWSSFFSSSKSVPLWCICVCPQAIGPRTGLWGGHRPWPAAISSWAVSGWQEQGCGFRLHAINKLFWIKCQFCSQCCQWLPSWLNPLYFYYWLLQTSFFLPVLGRHHFLCSDKLHLYNIRGYFHAV